MSAQQANRSDTAIIEGGDPMMTRKQLKALKRHKEHVRRRNILTNNIPRDGMASAIWFAKHRKAYRI